MNDEKKRTSVPADDPARTQLTLRRDTVAVLRVRSQLQTGPYVGSTYPICQPSVNPYQA